MLTTVLIAISLAIDAFTVSIASGIILKKPEAKDALTIAAFFGIFQAGMPILGWLAGVSVRDLISWIDHWIAFGLLVAIGGKMIWDSFKNGSENAFDPRKMKVLLLLAIATSIDALAVGITLALLDIGILIPVLVIGTITFLLSLSGVFFGEKLGKVFEKRVGIVGGLVLIGIGTKILLEHMV